MVSTEDHSVAVAQIDNHVLVICSVQYLRPAGHEVRDGCGRAQICQPVLENLSDRRAQFALCMSVVLTDGPKQLRVEGKFQRVSPSG